MTTRTRIAAVSALLTVLAVAGSVHAQFTAPTCTPPNCNPAVIQNVDISATAQTANINISGSQKLGGTFQTGALAPVMTLVSDNLMYGNVGGTSTNGSLLLLQFGSADRLRVTLTGQMQLPLGSAGAPSYSFIGDTNTGLYSSVGDSMSFATNGVARTTINNSGLTVNSGVLAVPNGTNTAPSITFTGDTNTGIFRGTADTMSFVTNGVTGLTVSATNNVVIPGSLTVNGTLTSSGGVGGDGSSITNLNATNISSGTLNDARLSTNVTTYSGGGTFTGVNIFNNAANSFTGSGAGLTSLNASNISSGTLADGRLSSNVALYNANGTFTGNNLFSGMTSYGSAALPVIGAQNLIYGNVDTTSTGALLLLQNESVDRFRVAATGAVTATSFSGVGTSLTALNASNLTSGTVPSARISGTYSNALTFSGANSYTNQSTFGSASLVVAAGQNLLYGNMDTTSAGSLLLLQNESVDRFRVDAAGNVTIAGTITSTGAMTSGGQNVCLQNGTNCPPTLNGAGTTDYITKFTGTGSTVGNSIIYEDSVNGRIGIGTTIPGKTFEVRNGDLGTYSGNISASFGSVSAYIVANGGVGVTGQAVGVSSYGVVGVGEGYGVYGSGDYGGYFVGSDNFGGAGLYAEWNGTGVGGGIKGFTNRPAAWAGWFEATDGTNVNTKGLYVSAPDAAGGKALWVAGDALVTSDINVTGNETIGGVATEAYNVITNYTQYTGQAGDAAAGAGRMGYNTTTGKFRCYEGGAWKNCTDGAISSVTASGAGISVAPTTGAVLVSNTGVTSNIAGAGISVSAATGAVTITNTGDTNAANDITGLTAGAGISIGGAAPTLTVTNTGDTNAADDVTGSGTVNYVAKFTGAQAVGNSTIFDNGTNVGVGTASPNYPLSLGSTTANTKLALYETGLGNAYGLGVVPGLLATHLNGSGARFGWFDNSSLTTELMTLQGTGNLTVKGGIGGNGYVGNALYGVQTTGSDYGGIFYGGTYGVYGSGTAYAIYGAGDGYLSGEVGIGTGSTADYQLSVYNDSTAYAYLGRKDGGINGKGIMAYGQYYGGYFNDTDGTAYLYAAWGGYGAYGLGSTAGGYFANTSGGGVTYIGGYSGGGYGVYVGSGNTYGVVGYGNSTGARFYDSDNTATTFIAGASWGVEIITGGAVKPGGGSWSAPSDARTKEDIRNFKDGLDVVRKLNPVNYTYNGLGETPKGMKSIGFIAQEVEKVAPYMVQHQQKKLHPGDIDTTDMLVVDPSALNFINLNAIKDLDLRIDGFEAKIDKVDELDAKLRKLEERVRELEAEVKDLQD